MGTVPMGHGVGLPPVLSPVISTFYYYLQYILNIIWFTVLGNMGKLTHRPVDNTEYGYNCSWK